jgi:hypothetical protein
MQEEDDGCGDDRDDLEQDEQNVSRARRYLFRLTTFHLKYDKNDDLTAGSSRRVRYYQRVRLAWLISHQPAVLFSHNKPAASNQSAVLFSQNISTSHQPPAKRTGCTAIGCFRVPEATVPSVPSLKARRFFKAPRNFSY